VNWPILDKQSIWLKKRESYWLNGTWNMVKADVSRNIPVRNAGVTCIMHKVCRRIKQVKISTLCNSKSQIDLSETERSTTLKYKQVQIRSIWLKRRESDWLNGTLNVIKADVSRDIPVRYAGLTCIMHKVRRRIKTGKRSTLFSSKGQIDLSDRHSTEKYEQVQIRSIWL
jgi:hypothetical protein